MKFSSSFSTLDRDAIIEDAKMRKDDGWRYVQTLAVNLDEGVDVVYSYMKDGELINLVVGEVAHGSHLPSITDQFLEAFVFENEIHDLFGISFDGLKIDFLGNFYQVSTEYPMTIISPEKLAEREKQKKIEAAKAAKAAKESGEGSSGEASESKSQDDAELEAKLAAMDPEKAAKVRAAMAAKAKKAAAEDEGE